MKRVNLSSSEDLFKNSEKVNELIIQSLFKKTNQHALND